MEQSINRQMLDFIAAGPSVYHVTENLARRLREHGFTSLSERQPWTLQPGGRYFLCRSGSSLIAFTLPETERWSGFRMAAAHCDSPGFKLKYDPELRDGSYLRLNTEGYGGMIMASWLDRPLSVAGRLVLRDGDGLRVQTVVLDRDLLVIPSVAIHMDRSVNDGRKLTANTDTVPLMGTAECGSLRALLAEAAGVAEDAIADADLYVYCREPGRVIGGAEEFILSPRLDDLECAWACMEGLLRADASGDALQVCCIFNNEEVGSETKQGAGSTLLRDTLRRICLSTGRDEAAFQALLAGSFLVSADNAHALHPNHPEYADSRHAPRMNGGVVIKYNANQRYATDGVSAAMFRAVCERAGVPVQCFANRSDLPGGSTLGSIADTLVPVATVDIGLAQLAMHSAVETAGAADPALLLRAMETYYSCALPFPEEE